ncbi:hypothetical protein PMZ80_006623 [Knufia obscura]|nr:hypothetical protein PMZ80_006623 [Knufia obscura]
MSESSPACSPEGREKLEQIAQTAGLLKRKGDLIKLISEPHAGSMYSFVDLKRQNPYIWMVDFQVGSRFHFQNAPLTKTQVGDWVTVLDIGSLTTDTTTESIIENDPLLRLKEEIVSAGGRCGTIALHLGMLKAVVNKFHISVADLSPQIVGRGTEFFDQCETTLSNFEHSEYDDDIRLSLTLDADVDMDDYDPESEEVMLQPDELEQVIDDFLVYPIKLLEDQWTTAWEKYGVKVKTVIICGGGAMIPRVLKKLEDFCASRGVQAHSPRDPIAAVSRGAVISEVSEKLLGQRMATASFGIKLEKDGQTSMHWHLSTGDILDTTKAAVHKGLSGYLSLSIAQLLNHGTTYKIQVYMYQGRLPEPKSPGGTEN